MKFPNISKRPWKNIDIIIIGFLTILDGLGSILSIGFYIPQIEMSYLFWRSRKMCERPK